MGTKGCSASSYVSTRFDCCRESAPEPLIPRLAERLNIHPKAFRDSIRPGQEPDAAQRDNRPRRRR